MRTSEIIGYLKSEGYEVKNSIANEMFGKVCVLRQQKGSLSKQNFAYLLLSFLSQRTKKR